MGGHLPGPLVHDLPKAAQDYVKAIEELSGAPVSAIGVGPRRDQTLQLRPLL